MADSEDLKLLMSGALDLSRCDFRGANLDGMDLRGRDFSNCLFEKTECEGTEFGGSDFQGAKVSFVKAKNAVFDGCSLGKIHFVFADLTGASLRDVKAAGAIFSNTKLNRANLQGALLTGGQIDADTSLEDVISDERTDFEGLRVLRPTSRNPLFRDYRFEKGVLYRRRPDADSEPSNSSSDLQPDSSATNVNSSTNKRNQVPPPAFPASVGEIEFDYTSHDGRALIGQGQTAFETSWSNGGSSAIHVYNDPRGIRGVAIAPDASSPTDVTMASVAGLDFTSRSRTPREGQVVVFENTSGRYLAVQVVDVLATSHGDQEDRLVLRYIVVPTDDSATELAEIVSLAKAAERTLKTLRPDAKLTESSHGGIGHNNPPQPIPLNTDELDRTLHELQVIRLEAERNEPDKAKLEESKSFVATVAREIASWVGQKCDIAADEFAKQIGKTLGGAKFLAAAWLAFSGTLDQLVAAIGALLR
jgi:hypothetical protein